jgi:hypothetical protein
MCSLINVSEEQSKNNSLKAPGVSLLSNGHRFHPDFSKSLYAIDSASEVYGHFVKATISLKLVAQPLCNSAWFRCLLKRWEPGYNNENPWSTQTPLLTPLRPPLPDQGLLTLALGTLNIRLHCAQRTQSMYQQWYFPTPLPECQNTK